MYFYNCVVHFESVIYNKINFLQEKEESFLFPIYLTRIFILFRSLFYILNIDLQRFRIARKLTEIVTVKVWALNPLF